MIYSAIAIIFNKDSKALLLKRMEPQRDFSGYWGFPGGAMEGFEEPFECAIRETKEETNLNIWHLKCVKKEQDFLKVYTTRKFEGDIILSFEHTEYAWASLEELDSYNLIPGSKELIERASNL